MVVNKSALILPVVHRLLMLSADKHAIRLDPEQKQKLLIEFFKKSAEIKTCKFTLHAIC